VCEEHYVGRPETRTSPITGSFRVKRSNGIRQYLGNILFLIQILQEEYLLVESNTFLVATQTLISNLLFESIQL
jgi:hypothetical protein